MNLDLVSTLLYFLVGGFLIFLAVTVLRDNFANRLNRLTGAMLFFGGLGPLFVSLADVILQSDMTIVQFEDTTLYHLYPLWTLFFPFLLIFSWTFPVDRFSSFRNRRIQYLVFLPPVVHLMLLLFYESAVDMLMVFQLDPEQTGFTTLILKPVARVTGWLQLFLGILRTYQVTIFSLVYVGYVLIAGYFFESNKSLVSNPRLYKQTANLMWALRFSLGVWVMVTIGELFWDDSLSDVTARWILLVGLMLGAGFFAYSAIRYQFLDLRLVFRQSFVYTLTSALLVGVFVIVVLRSEQLLTPLFGPQAHVVSYGFIIIVLLLFQPINTWLDNVIRALFMRTRTDHRNALERFSRQVISVFDPQRLRQIIADTMKTTLLVEQVTFVMFDDELGEYAVLPTEDSPTRRVIAREDLMLRGINLLDRPTFYQSLVDYRTDSRLAQLLEERQSQLIVPMKDAKHLLGFLALSKKAAGYKYSSEDLNLLGVLSNQMVSALTNARLYVDSLERMRLQEEVTMARQIQLDLLPSQPPELDLMDICAYSVPSRTVGGDFYDFIPLPDNRLGMVIADASGKGMPAALMIAQIQAMIRSEVNNGAAISTMLRNVNGQMVHSSSSEKYVTLFYGELDCNRHVFRYANAGHNYPLLVRQDGSTVLLKTGGPIIGALPDMEYQSEEIPLKPHDVLFFFTDGVSEAMNDDEQEYTEERIHRFVCEHRQLDPEKILYGIVQDVQRHDPTNPPRDDTTIIAIKVNGDIIAAGASD
jgi:sigma-B regulation protein RsbU (phosphoserine phosphatase)